MVEYGTLAEIEKRSFHDRNLYLGDPGFGKVRQKLFTDAVRLKRIAASIDPHRDTPSEALPGMEAEKLTVTFDLVAPVAASSADTK